MTYAVRTPRMQLRLERLVRGRGRPDEFVVRYEPSLVRLIAIARSLKYIEASSTGTSFSLADQGRALYQIIAEQGLFVQERFFFEAIARQLSEAEVTAIMRGTWR